MRRAIGIVLASALLLGSLAGCTRPASQGAETKPGQGAGSTTEAGQKATGKTIVVGLQAEPTNLDPAQISDYNSSRAADGMFDRLVRFKDGSTELEPGLAESWDISQDGLVYTFHLRKGVKFHDGTEFNADAVKFSIERQIDPNHPYHNTGEFAYADFTFGKVKEVRIKDPYTVEIELKEPYAPFLSNLAIHAASIVSPEAVKKYGKDFTKHPVGTGPFRFVRWTPGVEVVLEKNPEYWKGAPKIDQVIYRPVIEDQARLTEFEAGQLDFIVGIPPEDLARLKQNPQYEVQEQPGMHVWYVVLNATKPPFDNPKVRQAVNYAVNRKAIVEQLLRSTGVLATGPLPPVVWGYTKDVPQYPYDPEKAKQLLAEAGYPNGFSAEFWVPESGSGMQQPREMATAIQADLQAVGIQTRIQTFEWGTYLDKVMGDKSSLPEMFEMSWIGDNGDPDNFLHYLLASDQAPPNGFNLGYYSNPKADQLLKQAQRLRTQAERQPLYEEALKLLVADAPWIWVDHETQIVAYKKSIKGFQLHPTGVFRFETVDIQP
ncbi:ABC transporter substrate-binding protein [Caldinitratiruptor microaerophilus]|uniref:ABC transporter substrate-binding protein n=1 Tax=Caldinitratiruptor microaerophilus TaxID=671077 RepID=A0AA35CNP9_9FIRM|nr:ABC transporter substrate-binding protein [Caldinitratiruptor microaerophilus]